MLFLLIGGAVSKSGILGLMTTRACGVNNTDLGPSFMGGDFSAIPGTATWTSVWTITRAFLSPTPTPHAPCALLYVVPMLVGVLVGVLIGAWDPMF